MSHFTVLVIGDNPESQLAPYDENIKGDFEWGDSKWDWYELGGRWTGFFKMKDGLKGVTGRPGLMTSSAKPGYADQALKEQIDFDGMREDAVRHATEEWDEAYKIIGNQTWESWEKIREKHPDDIQNARTEYHEQPTVKACMKNDHRLGYNLDRFLTTKEKFILRARNSAISTFAIVKDGKWHEQGRMGWFGMVSNKKREGDWNEEFSTLLDSLPDDTLLSLYDCHI